VVFLASPYGDGAEHLHPAYRMVSFDVRAMQLGRGKSCLIST
jgi:hypothetical protein